MPHELMVGLEASAVVLLFLLLVPKRGVDHLRARFSDLHSGRRRWLFEPLVLRGGQRARNVAVDAAEVFELGVPLYVVGRLAEQRSAQLELERQSRWVDSPKALLAAHLKGVINEAELHGQLKVRGLPLPATKAVAAKVEARPLISARQACRQRGSAGGFGTDSATASSGTCRRCCHHASSPIAPSCASI